MIGVTMFGVFLTPVFFYVIQGFGESRWLSGPRVRKVALLRFWAALWAWGSGSLLQSLAWLISLVWGPLLGVAAGLLLVLSVLDVHRRLVSE